MRFSLRALMAVVGLFCLMGAVAFYGGVLAIAACLSSLAMAGGYGVAIFKVTGQRQAAIVTAAFVIGCLAAFWSAVLVQFHGAGR